MEQANPAGMSGSEQEPTVDAELVLEQMREATDRLRGQGWKVAPLPPATETTEEPALEPAEEPAEETTPVEG